MKSEQRVASIWDGGEEDVLSTEKIYVEELGVSYQKTGRFDLSGCSILKSQTAAKDLNLTIENAWQKVVDVICISKTMGTTVTENYFSVSPALMELLSIQVTIQSENALLLGTEKVSIELKNANTVRNFVPVFANKTDLQLYTQDGKLIEDEVFPAFLCIDNQLYISADALAKSMSMEHTLDGYGYGDGVFRKNRIKQKLVVGVGFFELRNGDQDIYENNLIISYKNQDAVEAYTKAAIMQLQKWDDMSAERRDICESVLGCFFDIVNWMLIARDTVYPVGRNRN